jgi:NAD+ diphosphatase
MTLTMPYSGLGLDRASGRRTDPRWVERLRTAAGTRVIPLWQDRCLVRDGAPVVLSAGAAGEVFGAAGDPVLLGLDGPSAVFAADLSTLAQVDAAALVGADTASDVRGLVTNLTPDEAGVLAYARGILHWHRNQRFCGMCGGPTDPRDGGHQRICRSCGRLLFPRIEPAVIVLVELPGEPWRCLLGRHEGGGAESYGTLAGFVEIGESLEDAVRREVAEEAGVTVGEVTYQASQAWPFPAGLMIGFRARAVSAAIEVDGAELLDARWFTAADLHARMAASGPAGLFRVDSIGKFLVETWLADRS